jgi:hypothetical protein
MLRPTDLLAPRHKDVVGARRVAELGRRRVAYGHARPIIRIQPVQELRHDVGSGRRKIAALLYGCVTFVWVNGCLEQ